MKRPIRYILWSLLLALTVAQLPGQEVHRAEILFSMEEFRVENSGEDAAVVTAFDPLFFYPDDSEMPALPLRTIRFLVPGGAVLLDYHVVAEEEIVAGGIRVEKSSPPVPTGHTGIAGSPGVFTGSYPASTVIHHATMIQRGYTWFSFVISPFRYDPDRLELYLSTRLEIEISYRVEEEQVPVVRPDRSLIHALKENVLNPGDMEGFYPQAETFLQKSSEDPVDYLVITSGELAPEFIPLTAWKTRKGLSSRIITLDQIENEYEGSTIQLKIKKCLYDHYLHHDLKWVLLGGDDQVVPAQGCYGKITFGRDELIDPTIPTDLFYACFDQRFDWNSSNDEKIGELFKDGHDLYPEVYLSRVPVRTPEHVRSFVKKTLDYEIRQPVEGFSDKMLLAGVKSWILWNGKSDSHHHSELMFNLHISRYWKGDKMNFFDTGTDFSEKNDYHVTTGNLSEQLNSGYGIFHFAGHGNLWALMMESGPGFSTEDACNLESPFSGLILSNSCDVNAFDSIDPCLSEAFMRNPTGGSVAFFGSSRYGFGNPKQSSDLGPSLKYNASFLKYLLADIPQLRWRNLGAVAALAKSDFAHNGSNGGVYHYLLYAINPMGDPELPLFTGRPSQFENVRIFRFSNTLSVNTGGVRGSRICITSLDLEEGYQAVADGVSHHTFEDIPDAFQVTITAPDHIPYRYISGYATGMQDDILPFVSVYPNPVHEILRIGLDLPAATVALYDMQGRILWAQEIRAGESTLDMSGYPDGVYMLNITAGDRSGWQKVLKSSK